MKEPDKPDYSEIYRIKELKLLKARVKKTQLSLQLCSILIFVSSLFFCFFSSAFGYINLTLYLIISFLILGLAAYSNKKPYKAVSISMLLMILSWASAVMIEPSDIMLLSNIIWLIALAILIFAIKTAREADIIKRELRLS